ncbi:8-oxo-dGTP pyrophosphatase MutT (NUDIX family) [Pontibacter ummariensis]|uniref:GDP-mannose pyrophosphatase n=1 Tax=Pontibacter ummariensis TaxID=1610492 RepID=A0A239KLA9_9BACT|nr:NUDIX hydrolase [Pontibacter ummariensis]PRY05722.1 8-oxo-dGTP pyrophosphatase MutT (NUDIX family) [Pontibacter ummariensis]SNT17964.1 8-oxo-dGTP pyrophosphatase MutT, NUDIX family [Pontibacter ummariensis]
MEDKKPTHEPQPWKVLKSELVFNEKWYTLRRDEVELPNGLVMDDYYVSVRPNVVLIFPLTEDKHVIFVRQYKHAAGDIFIELPGGVIDEHEDAPLEAAKRELLEETGYTSDEVELLQEVIDNPTKDTNKIYFFLARNVHKVAEQDLDASENIEVLRVPLQEVEEMVLNGKVKVSGSVALCLLALRKLGV